VACASLSHIADQAINIKIEEFSDMEVWEDPVPLTFVGIKAEHEVSCVPTVSHMSLIFGMLSFSFPLSKVGKKKIYGTTVIILMQCRMAVKAYPVLCNDVTVVTDKGLVVLQNCMCSQKEAPGLHGEVCPSSSHSGDQAVSVKVEKFSDMGDREDSVSVTSFRIKAEYEVSCVCPLLGISHSQSELHILFLICICQAKLLHSETKTKTKLYGLSPQANYTANFCGYRVLCGQHDGSLYSWLSRPELLLFLPGSSSVVLRG
jgi:hypothetical protein